jgi:flagellar motor protein MotB
MRSYRNNPVKVDEENPYWVSFSDLMSGLLVIFILASVALIIQITEARVKFEQEMIEKREELQKEKDAAERLQVEVEKLKEELRLAQLKIQKDIDELKNAERARHEILQTVQKQLAKQNIAVEIVDNDTVLRIPETTLTFEPNSYTLPKNEKLQSAVAAIGEALHKAVLEPFTLSEGKVQRFEYLDTIFIEGHTDSRPTSRVKGNWGLSTFRSISLWEFWQETLTQTPTFSEMENSKGQKLFSVSGYASSRRLRLVEETADQRRANRRIDIRFTVKRPTIADLEAIVR